MTPLQHLDPQPLEEALIGPVLVTPAPVALLRTLSLWAAPPLVVGAVALPAQAGVWGVIESWHLKGSPQPEPEGRVGQ